MKRILFFLCFLLTLATASAQDDRNGQKIQERMREYIQQRLNLSKAEADRFAPTFLEYFNELRKTNQQYSGDQLVLQQKIIDLRLRYREQFKNIMGEKRSNEVFQYERDFVDEVKKLRQERLQDKNDKNLNKRLRGQLP